MRPVAVFISWMIGAGWALATAGEQGTPRPEAAESHSQADLSRGEVSPEALPAWVKQERQAGRPLTAVQFAQDVLRRQIRGVGVLPASTQGAGTLPAPLRAAIIGQIAAGYFDAGDVLNGLAWLKRGEREHGGERWLDEGREETFRSLRDQLVGRGVAVQGDWPRLAPPLREAYRLDRPGAILLLPQERPGGFKDAGAGEPVLLFNQGRIEALDPESGQALWEASPVPVGTPVWLGTRGSLLVFSTKYQLFALDGRTGAVRWTVGDVPRRALSPAIDPEVLTRITSWALGETLAVALLSDGRGMAVEVASGQILWNRALPRKAGGPCTLNDEHVAYVAQGQPTGVVVLEATTGREVGVLPLGQAGQPLRCEFTPLRTMLAAGSDWLACFDPYTRERLWRVEGMSLRVGSILLGANGFYVAHETGIACRSYADGGVLWERQLSGLVGGSVLQAWLDAGRVYALTGRGAAALDAASGQVLWATRWDEAASAGPAWLTRRHLLVLGVGRVRAEGGENRWELKARWVDRETGHKASVEWEPLGQYEAVPEVGVYDRVLITRAGAVVSGWTR